MLIAASGANVIRGSTLYDMMTSQGSMTTPTFGAPPGFIPGSSNPLSARGTIIPMNSLASIGLHGDVVSRIREMQSYLNQVSYLFTFLFIYFLIYLFHFFMN